MYKAIEVLLSARKKYTTEQAEADPVLFFGFVKHIEIIGEAAYMLTSAFKETHPEVEWNVIVAMRHVLVHGYYAIKPQQLWDTIDYDLPRLKPFIEGYLREEN